MEVGNKIYGQYLQILREELIPAMGCTEPIAMAYAAAKARQVLGEMPDKIDIVISGNIIKNVKSVVVPNTGGLKGITAAVAAGVTVGDADRQLEVLAGVREEDIHLIREFMDSCPMTVMKSQSPKLLDIDLRLYKGTDCVRLRIADYHTNIVLIEKNGDVLLRLDDASDDGGETDRSVLSVKGIVEFAECVRIDDVRELLERQIAYNTAISQEGLRGEYGASVGKTLLSTRGSDVRVRARAVAAAGSDARMSGCELPVVIVSGSGNQGMTASLPVIVYAQDMGADRDRLLRALVVSNLVTVHQKTPIGRLSAFCGAVSAGCGAAAGVAWLCEGSVDAVSATITNTLGMISGTVCDGAKPSCATKIASAVEAGLLGFDLYERGKGLCGGDGILKGDVEKTIESVGKLAREGMRETDSEILEIMLDD
ncbi:MAG: serine dehydratase subunit alpha family protein [Oscillospiraceae bacterium]|nr:serine dehydratase subunit alpha family protein [Oscillospiraceae bacterium]MDY2909211.1 L-serine ammonia-lyase, iron-sulfur-dependent, subunit alpha [Oscillospiraceae bacterium]